MGSIAILKARPAVNARNLLAGLRLGRVALEEIFFVIIAVPKLTRVINSAGSVEKNYAYRAFVLI
jgi:hypothetical protein